MGGFDPGRVLLRLTLRDGCVVGSEVLCERPDVTRLLRGKPAEQAAAMVPRIYALCGKAQAVAAQAALAAARGVAVALQIDEEVLAEAAREHAWSLLVDWPRRLGLMADEPLFVRVVRGAAPERPGLASALREHANTQAMRDLLAASDRAIDRRLLDRLESRLAQLLGWLERRGGDLGRVVAEPTGTAAGRAVVETARGALIHELALDADCVANCRIIAPTDVHFAADGTLATWLDELRGLPRDDAGRLAERAVMTLDPCVPWRCRFC